MYSSILLFRSFSTKLLSDCRIFDVYIVSVLNLYLISNNKPNILASSVCG